jgi:hypothetical protein
MSASETSGLMIFGNQEVSEIRAEQLVSKSFVMNLGELNVDPRSEVQEVVMLDVEPGAREDDEESTDDSDSRDIPIPEAVQDDLSPYHGLGGLEHEVVETVSGEHHFDPSMLEEVEEQLVSPLDSVDLAPPVDEMGSSESGPSGAAGGAGAPNLAHDFKRLRREASERIPRAHIRPQDGLGAPAARGGRTSSDPGHARPDGSSSSAAIAALSQASWALAGFEGSDGPTHDSDDSDDVTASGLGIEESATGTDTHDIPDLGPPNEAGVPGSAKPRERSLDTSDLDSTQAAKRSGMGSLDTGPKPVLPPASRVLGSGHFEEDTPYSPLLRENGSRGMLQPTISSLPSRSEDVTLDPNAAARAPGEEFDAILEEIRDFTHARSFDPDNEATSNEDDDELSKGKRASGADPKKRNRPRQG